MSVAAFCGSFDPINLGHLNVIERSSRIFDRVVVVVSNNTDKVTLFTNEQRLEWVKQACAHLDNVSCELYDGLVADACKEFQAEVLVRGVRNAVDLEYEQNMAYMNAKIQPGLDTVCLFTENEYRYCSSSNVRESLKYGLDIRHLVPECVAQTIEKGETQ